MKILSESDLTIDVTNLKSGDQFELSQVHQRWDAYDEFEQRALGKLFKKRVTETNVYPNIEYVREKSNHHALYKKI